jgi:hypothetical protein
LALAFACAACERRAGEAGARGVSALPREGITVAQRDQWRAELMWPDQCEDAFQTSHAGQAGGIRVVRMSATASVVEVTCAAGSYQPSALRFRVTEDGANARSVLLSFPVYSSDDGLRLRLSRETEVWGESVITPAVAEIAILSLARQTADCGVWARYSLATDQPRLLAAAARVRCPATQGRPATLSAAGPPPGWVGIPRTD